MSDRLANKTVVVTGAAHGIGRAYAERLASEGAKAAVPHLRRNGGGSIVNIGSSTIFRGVPTRAHYVAAKSALIGFNRTIARELGKDNIRVNLVCPGSTLSEENPSEATIKMRDDV